MTSSLLNLVDFEDMRNHGRHAADGLTIFGLKGPSMVGSLFLLFFFFDVSRVDVLAREKLLAGNGFAIAPELV